MLTVCLYFIYILFVAEHNANVSCIQVDLRNNTNHPAIIHCPSGIDTTSILIAIGMSDRTL